MRVKSFLKRNLFLFLCFIAYITFTNVLGFSCPLKILFDTPCPTCGVTRALYSLLRLDLEMYFKYNVMAIPLLISVCLFLNINFFRRKKFVYIFGYTVLIINMVYYIVRIIVMDGVL